jgi:Methyltransferase domain
MDRAAKTAALEQVLGEKAKLHHWGGEWQDGGLSDDILRGLFAHACAVTDGGAGVILETGAGLSSLVFLAAAPQRVITIAPNADLRDRIVTQIAKHGFAAARWEFHLGRSEEVLPDLAKAEPQCVDLALIDGGHGMATVFVDFCFINMLLKKGGYLALDDIQLHSVRQLYLLLKHQPGFEVTAEFGKLVVLRKTDERRFLPEWSKQPFVVHNS